MNASDTRPLPRVTRGLPFADYIARDSVHFSALKAMDLSPMHYRRARDIGRADTSALAMGRMTHAAILTPELPGVAVWDGAARRGKEWKDYEAAHAGETIVKRADLATAHAMRSAVLAHPVAGPLLSEGEAEVTIEWEDTDTRLPCRARVDWLRPDGGMVELKTTRHVGPHEFMREFARRMYHAQVAFYEDGLSLANPPDTENIHVIAVESLPPHDVCVYRVGLDVLEAGRRKVQVWMRSVAECTAAGKWPGLGSDRALDMVLPDWALVDGLEDVDIEGIEGSDEG